MGSKLSTPGSDPTAQCPGTEDIHTAYRQGDPSRARHLLREACDESTSQLEKVRPEPTRPARTGPLWAHARRSRLPFVCHHRHGNGDSCYVPERPRFPLKRAGASPTVPTAPTFAGAEGRGTDLGEHSASPEV